jgi:hypothetical protein
MNGFDVRRLTGVLGLFAIIGVLVSGVIRFSAQLGTKIPNRKLADEFVECYDDMINEMKATVNDTDGSSFDNWLIHSEGKEFVLSEVLGNVKGLIIFSPVWTAERPVLGKDIIELSDTLSEIGERYGFSKGIVMLEPDMTGFWIVGVDMFGSEYRVEVSDTVTASYRTGSLPE